MPFITLMQRVGWLGGAVAAVTLTATVCCAGTMTTAPALRQAAITACTGDVLRLCPTTVFDEEKVFACMRANRAELTPSCRAVFDEGAKTVRR